MDPVTDGATPLDEDEAEGLIPTHLETRADLNEWEQANIADALPWLSRRRSLEAILTMEFTTEVHRRMFGRTWRWAGSFRRSGKTIGIDWAQVPESLRNLLDNTRHQIDQSVLDPDEIALRFHHELVRIHPFANGNGRHAREMTDQLLRAMHRPEFGWGRTLGEEGEARSAYLSALRRADTGSFDELRRFVRS